VAGRAPDIFVDPYDDGGRLMPILRQKAEKRLSLREASLSGICHTYFNFKRFAMSRQSSMRHWLFYLLKNIYARFG